MKSIGVGRVSARPDPGLHLVGAIRAEPASAGAQRRSRSDSAPSRSWGEDGGRGGGFEPEGSGRADSVVRRVDHPRASVGAARTQVVAVVARSDGGVRAIAVDKAATAVAAIRGAVVARVT